MNITSGIETDLFDEGKTGVKQQKFSRKKRQAEITPTMLLDNLDISGTPADYKEGQVYIKGNDDFDLNVKRCTFRSGARGIYVKQTLGVINMDIEHSVFTNHTSQGSGAGIALHTSNGDIILKVTN